MVTYEKLTNNSCSNYTVASERIDVVVMASLLVPRRPPIIEEAGVDGHLEGRCLIRKTGVGAAQGRCAGVSARDQGWM